MAVPFGSLAVSYCRVDSLSANVQMFRECFLSERPSPCRGGGVPQAQSPAQHLAPHHCERVLCSAVSPLPSSSSLQALLHKDAPHADRHRVQVRLPRLLVSVRLWTSSDSLRTLFKDYDFSRDTAVTKLVALWWEPASQAPRQLWCLWYCLWTLGFERLP